MRQIKFRAWDKFNNNMCNVLEIDFGKQNVTVMFRNVLANKLELDEVELMQFTGLKDCKGNDIYDGDIVKALKHNEDSFTNEIVWRGGALWFGNWNWIEFQNIFRGIEVIGNKYESPTP